MKRFGSTKRSKGLPRILTATTTYLLPEGQLERVFLCSGAVSLAVALLPLDLDL
jgi:hypothetical protein